MKLNQTLQILYEDTHIIVCKKPAGIATQSSSLRTPDMEQLIKRHLYRSTRSSNSATFHSKEKSQEPYLAIIHRLDQPVSGILVFAKTPAAAKELNKQLQSTGFGKYYKALLTKEPPISQADKPLTHYMKKNAATNTSSICSKDDKLGKKATLTYTILGTPTNEDVHLFSHCGITNFDTICLVKVKLDTGRHHQIRVQMSALECPIWGDTKYGIQDSSSSSSQDNWVNIALCAYKLEFKHPFTKKKLSFKLEQSV